MDQDELTKKKEFTYESAKLIRADLVDSHDTEILNQKIKGIADSRKYVIVEAGCGINPKLSCRLKQSDALIAIDPNVTSTFIGVNRGENKVTVGSGRLVVRGKIEDVRNIKANRINLVAPNPRNIVEDGLLNEIEPMLKKDTEMLIVLDKRTRESEEYLSDAMVLVKKFLEKNKMERLDDDTDMRRSSYYMNSEDLGSSNVVIRAKKSA